MAVVMYSEGIRTVKGRVAINGLIFTKLTGNGWVVIHQGEVISSTSGNIVLERNSQGDYSVVSSSGDEEFVVNVGEINPIEAGWNKKKIENLEA